MNAPVTVNTPIYLDYLSTTPVDPRVVAAMTACMSTEGVYGNAASRSHVFGWQAEEAVENARSKSQNSSMQILARSSGPRVPPSPIIWRSKG